MYTKSFNKTETNNFLKMHINILSSEVVTVKRGQYSGIIKIRE